MNNAPTGCTACTTGYWSIEGNGNTCYAISCSSTGYTGTSGSCTCASGYYGSVSYVSGSLNGCTICSAPTSGRYTTSICTSSANTVTSACSTTLTSGRYVRYFYLYFLLI